MARKRFDQVSEVDAARIHKARTAVSQAKSNSGKDRDFTIPGLIALFGIVLVTALYLNDNGTIAYQASDSPNVAGGAFQTGSSTAASDTVTCEAQSYCDGSKLVRQNADCTRFVGYCQNGCAVKDAFAVCR